MCGCAEALVRAVVAFFDAVLVDCFLSWFRRRPGPDSPASAHRDPLVPKGRGGEALPASDEEKGFAESTGSNEQLADGDDTDEELRREAAHLQLYGTISQTPAELRNVSYESNSESANESDDMSINALARGGTSVSGFNSSECFKCEEDLMTELEVLQDKSLDSVPRSVLRDKSPFWSMQNRFSDCSGSPFPTPLVLRDDMQTPGTIYASHTGSTISRKRVRTRKQFIYPVLRPIENKLQQMEPPEDSSPMLPSSSPKRTNLGADHIKKLQQTSSNSVTKVGFSKSVPFSFPSENASYQEKGSPPSEESKCQTRSPNLLDGGALSKSNSDEKRAAMSLTHWLKPSSTDNENQGVVTSSASDQPRDENTLFTESPVFTAASGMDADVDNPTPRFPKAWDGNGIPNTTTKYKEDQKVSWHATPFEERLLRVLSDEQPNAPRKLIRGDLFLVEEET
ncbi:uncharacterized protein LOC119332637 [Triticum dicoccoides]|uniref:uncharacterized protein LOC119332637 n=1 Tax=Triticum dicoccoides TaxID=85692 RepID=UPI0018915F88|nr:uncharacterized protein LOC119332637 [Triticum dicoccoides]